MKRKLIACLVISIMALSFMVPLKAADVYVAEPVNVVAEEEVGIAPLSEMTRIYWRTYRGQLQFRVWGIISGRWLTDWTDFT